LENTTETDRTALAKPDYYWTRTVVVVARRRRRTLSLSALSFRSLLLSSERATPTPPRQEKVLQFPIAFRPCNYIHSGSESTRKERVCGGRDGKTRKTKKSKTKKARTKPTPARVMVCSAFGKDGMMTTTMIVYVCGFFEVVVVWCG